jgi:hypothetical protein
MVLYRLSLVAMMIIWGASLYMWQMSDEARWELGIHELYTSTFLEIPLFTFVLGVVLIFQRKSCTSRTLRISSLSLCWLYTFFPLISSVLLIVVTFLGITGY